MKVLTEIDKAKIQKAIDKAIDKRLDRCARRLIEKSKGGWKR